MSKVQPLARLGMEPPLRLLVRQVLKYLPVSAKTRAVWEVSQRPAYLLGMLTAAEQARKQQVREISVIEFGVAGGQGLIAMQREAEAIEREIGVIIKVYGFDMGAAGLPALVGDYRDHPDMWCQGDYAMDESALRTQLTARTTLILGDVQETVPVFFQHHEPPAIGFISFDLDLYTSTRAALRILALPETKMLRHVPLYFDDIGFLENHRNAGELLAIREFNETHSRLVIDRWYGVRSGRPFPERPFLDKLYVLHDLEAISRSELERPSARLPLSK
jgi:hypothetical protein